MPGRPDLCCNPGITFLDIKTEIDRLYQVPLADFVAARNQLATRLRRLDRDAAQKVKKLAKPSVSAWAVNQAFWHGRSQFDALLAAGDKLRDLQKRALAGETCAGDMQAAMLAQRAALQAVKEHAARALERDGHGAGNAMMRRVSISLEALAAYGNDPAAPEPGRLSADVPAPGFGALSALAGDDGPAAAMAEQAAPKPNGPDGARRSANDNEILTDAERQARAAEKRAHDDARQRARVQAQRAVEEARAELSARQRAIDSARALEKTCLDRVYAAEKAVETAERELKRARTTRDEALRSAEEAKADTRTASTAANHAEVLLVEAEKRLAELD